MLSSVPRPKGRWGGGAVLPCPVLLGRGWGVAPCEQLQALTWSRVPQALRQSQWATPCPPRPPAAPSPLTLRWKEPAGPRVGGAGAAGGAWGWGSRVWVNSKVSRCCQVSVPTQAGGCPRWGGSHFTLISFPLCTGRGAVWGGTGGPTALTPGGQALSLVPRRRPGVWRQVQGWAGALLLPQTASEQSQAPRVTATRRSPCPPSRPRSHTPAVRSLRPSP